jgi:hypothetical protein
MTFMLFACTDARRLQRNDVSLQLQQEQLNIDRYSLNLYSLTNYQIHYYFWSADSWQNKTFVDEINYIVSFYSSP